MGKNQVYFAEGPQRVLPSDLWDGVARYLTSHDAEYEGRPVRWMGGCGGRIAHL